MSSSLTPLTPKQSRFVEEYLLDLNATQAAIRAGYSKKTAKTIAAQNLAKLPIRRAIAAAKRERSENTKIDAEWVLQQAVELHQRCMQELKPALHPKTRKQIKDDDGHAIYTFNAAAANRALEIIGKHVEVSAFKDRFEVTNGPTLAELIQAGRNRAWQAKNEPEAGALEAPSIGGGNE